MLHELFIAMVGFTGDLIVEGEKTFKVNDRLGVFSKSEIDQISKIVPLGFIYNQIQSFVTRNELQWTQKSSCNQTYIMALSNGISDILSDYVNDVTFLEEIVSTDQPMPLSQVYQYLQKYFIIFPVLHTICQEIESTSIKGCQILEYLSNFQSGVPVLMAAIESIVSRVNTVFFRQSVGWMIYGQLEDPGEEYFVRYGGPKTNVLGDVFAEKSHIASSWNRSYLLQLNYIPSSHITARQASKILFSGKVSNLLNSFQTTNNVNVSKNNDYLNSDTYYYLSRTHLELENDSQTRNCNINTANTIHDIRSAGKRDTLMTAQLEGLMFSPDDLKHYTKLFEVILKRENNHKSIITFRQLVEDIHSKISGALWKILCEHNIMTFFQYMRNLFLLGKGEFYQNIMDELLNLTIKPLPEMAAVNNILKWSVLKSSAKKLNLDDELLNNMMEFSLSTHDVAIVDFFSHSYLFTLSHNAHIRLNNPPILDISISSISLCNVKSSKVNACRSIWENEVFNKVIQNTQFSEFKQNHNTVDCYDNSKETYNEINPIGSCIKAVFWLNEIKEFSRGFSFSLSFLCDWTILCSNLQTSNVAFKDCNDVCLGEMKIILNDDKSNLLAANTNAIGVVPKGSIFVNFSFYATSNEGTHTVDYYAKLSSGVSDLTQGVTQMLTEKVIQLQHPFSPSTSTPTSTRTLNPIDVVTIDIEYFKKELLLSDHNNVSKLKPFSIGTLKQSTSDYNDSDSMMTSSTSATKRTQYTNRNVSFVNVFRAKVNNETSIGNKPVKAFSVREASKCTVTEDDNWDVTATVDFTCVFSKSSMGTGYVCVEATSLILTDSPSLDHKISQVFSGDNTGYWNLSYDVHRFRYYQNSDISSSVHLVSQFTQSNHVDTYVKLTGDIKKFKLWLTLKLRIKMPNRLFSVLFDEDAMNIYEALFSNLIKIRLVSHSLERLWHGSKIKRVSFGSSQDRYLNHLRQIMHFFMSSLTYYLQIDVVDSEFCQFLRMVETISNNTSVSSSAHESFPQVNHFQKVYKSHKDFLVTVSRLSYIDNSSVGDVIDKILMICIRFITLCRLKLEQEEQLIYKSSSGNSKNVEMPVIIPMEEIVAIKKEFLKKVEYLFKVVNKLESQSFLFRLDFNGYFTDLFNEC